MRFVCQFATYIRMAGGIHAQPGFTGYRLLGIVSS